MPIDVRVQAGRTYPNGMSRLRLLQSYLSCRDVGCPPEKYEEDLAFLAIDERQGAETCQWTEDVDGKLVVLGVALADPSLRIIITDRGFAVALRTAPRVFISYAREDHAAAQELVRRLDSEGFAPWFDNVSFFQGRTGLMRSNVRYAALNSSWRYCQHGQFRSAGLFNERSRELWTSCSRFRKEIYSSFQYAWMNAQFSTKLFERSTVSISSQIGTLVLREFWRLFAIAR